MNSRIPNYTYLLGLFACCFTINLNATIPVDVLVVFSEDHIRQTGESVARDRAASDLIIANEIYYDSQTDGLARQNTARLRMAGCIVINEDLSSLNASLQLARLSSPDIDNARNRYGADIVILYVSTGSDTAIAGQVIGIPSSSYSISQLRDYSYAVVRSDLMVRERYTVAHEIGHCLGAAHFPGSSISPQFWEFYSFGYIIEELPTGEDLGVDILTLMATPYGSLWTPQVIRIDRLSNPNHTYKDSVYTFGFELARGASNRNNARTLSTSPAAITQIANPHPFIHSTIHDSEWHSSWWGFFWLGEFESHWIWHDDHGWVFVEYTSTDDNFIYWDSNAGGWFYTTNNYYPWIWSFDNNQWTEYSIATKNPRVFTSFTSPINTDKNEPY